jgi:ABC-type polysaccharide/polyol phosphate transport system ATPase subunit
MSSEPIRPMTDDIAISVRNLTKSYRLFSHPGDRIKQFLSFGVMRYHREFTALKDVSFDIKKGETVGIIGRNGSGKSTLLQLICGILKPTSGSVQVTGRVSALLELGAGFNPEFTGRENVYFQGSIMGIAQPDMATKFDAIAAFADIGEFMDQPVRTYSSGMFVRLAFAVAAHVAPDILIVDEALAVGDAIFQQRCFDRIYEMQSSGMTMIVVSHDPYQIERLCHRAAVMDMGKLSKICSAKEVLSLYQELIHDQLAPATGAAQAFREGTQALHFERVAVYGAVNSSDGAFRTNETLHIVANIIAAQAIDNVRFRFELYSPSGLVTIASTIGLTEKKIFHGKHQITFTMPHCQLTTGRYYIDAIAVGKNVRLDTCRHVVEFNVLLKDEAALNLTGDDGVYVSQGTWEIS